MKLLKKLIPVLLLLALPLTFAAGSAKQIGLIPGDSRVIGAIDFNRLNKKGGFEEENFFEQLSERLKGELEQEELERLSQLIKETKDLGINSKGMMYFFVVPEFTVSDRTNRGGLIIPVDDDKLMEKLLKDADVITDETVINSYAGYRYVNQREVYLFWNKENLLFFISDALGAEAEPHIVEAEFERLFLNRQNVKKINSRKHVRNLFKESADLILWADAGLILQQLIKADAGLSSVERMRALITEYERLAKEYAKMASQHPYKGPKVSDEDMYYYDGSDFVAEENYGQASTWYKKQAEVFRKQVDDFMKKNKDALAETEKQLKKFQDLNVTFKGNFLNGRIALDMDIYTGPNLKFPKPGKSAENSKLTGFVPKNSLFLINADIALKEYYDFIHDISFGKMKKQLAQFEEGVESINMTVDELFETFTGSLLFSLYDVDFNRDDPNLFFAIEVKNKKRLQGIIDDLMENERFTKRIIKGLEVYIPDNSDPEEPETPYLIVKDSILYLVNGSARDNLLSGNTGEFTSLDGKVQILYKNSVVGLLDFESLSRSLAASREGEDADKLEEKAQVFILDRLDNITLNIKTINPRHLSCVLTLDFTNKEDNSMKELKNMLLDFLEDELRKKPEDSF